MRHDRFLFGIAICNVGPYHLLILYTLHSGRTGVGNQNYENFKIQFLHFNPSIWVFMSPIFQYFEKLWHFRPILNDFKIPILGWIYQISYIFGNFIV